MGVADARRGLDVTPHFCIIQDDDEGLSGWSLEDGSQQNRWDTLLEGLLKSLVMDGKWPVDARASAFVGPDAVHLTGDVQRLVMQPNGVHADGRTAYLPATLRAWEEVLWRSRSGSSSSISSSTQGSGNAEVPLYWRCSENLLDSQGRSRHRLLEHLDDVFAEAPDESVALVFCPEGADATYEQLKVLGRRVGRPVRSARVFLLLGGAHGFDNNDDRDCDDESLLSAILGRFAARFGPHHIIRVSLCEDGPAGAALAREARFPLAKMAGFLGVEYACGSLSDAIAGMEARLEAGVGLE